jgi:hypothetical protein
MIIQTKLRRDAAADWTSQDPTLAQAEIGIETDTDKLKIGDGSTAWTGLDYPYYLASEVDTEIDTDISTHAGDADAHHAESHNHDSLYYTEAEVDSISGVLSSEIDTDISTHAGDADAHHAESHNHDDLYYTEAEVTTISGDIVLQLHTQSHAITSTADHTAGTWAVIYTDDSGNVIELPLGPSGTVLTSQGESVAPLWV